MLVFLLVGLMTMAFVFAGGSAETASSSDKKVITIWYEGNDQRLPFFTAAEAEMQKDYPNYSINAITFDNATIVSKSLQAVTATGGVDLIFNEASRLMNTYQQSGGAFEDLTAIVASSKNKDVLTAADRSICSAVDKLIVFPINRSLSGLGYKTDVIDVSADQIPNTWKKFIDLGKRYKDAGINGWTLHLGTSPEQVLNLLLSAGNDIHGFWIDSTPKSHISQYKEQIADIIELYTSVDAIWDKDAINEDFAGMYTKIQSSRVGMFRVGNWNAGGWDKENSGVGEYSVTTYPSFSDDASGALIVGGVRGIAMPKNAPEKEAAKVFLQYCLSEAAQKASFETMGSCVDYSVVDTTKLSKNQKIFFDPTIKIVPTDSYEGLFSYYPELLETFQKGLTKAFFAKNRQEIISILDKLDTELNTVIAKNK
jgi:ABC-type glycerol-3-phosphate transport system substrate-binding protein